MLGFVLGVVFVLLIFAVVTLVGVNRSLAKQVRQVSAESFNAQALAGQYIIKDRERQAMKEAIVVSLSEDQITTLAHRVSSRVQTILNADNEAALKKLS